MKSIASAHRGSLPTVALLLALTLTAVPSAYAASIPVRTGLISAAFAGGSADGDSANPAVSGNDRYVVFDTTATNAAPDDLNGPIRDVVRVDLFRGTRTIVSSPGPGIAADGPSSTPAVSSDGETIAFTSAATNLVPGDTNGVADVFVRTADGTITRVSVSGPGAEGDGPSGSPDISADGRFVVFSSTASTLVADDRNGREDVFVHDRRDGVTSLVSITPQGTAGSGRSSTPAISADGAVVSFESTATDLVADDENRQADVFARNIFAGRTALVSVSGKGTQQDRGLAGDFRMQSDVSADGRYVVFDSDATNLTSQDRNRSTDVFLRDRRSRTTKLVSASSVNVQGNNDSFAPTITPNGRRIVFRSYATNLVRGDGAGEDILVRDLVGATTTTVDVTADGARRIPAPIPPAGRQAAISDSSKFVAFASASPNLTAGDVNRAADVFLRQIEAPQTSEARKRAAGSRVVRLGADDPNVDRFLCRLDGGPAFGCGTTVTVPGSASVLEARAGGLGMLYDLTPLTVRLGLAETVRPTVTIRTPKGSSLRVIRGTASDASGIRGVEVSVAYLVAGGCEHLRRVDGTNRLVRAACTRKFFVPATGGRSWQVRLPRAVRGAFRIVVRATDNAGNRSRSKEIRVVVA